MPNIDRMIALGWGDPDNPSFRAKHIKTLKVRGVLLPVNANADIQYLFRVLVTTLDGFGAKVAQHRDDWGYANRNIRGASATSYHAWGLAVDIDALENLLGTPRTTFPVDKTRRLVKRLGMKWGHDFEGRKDPMHFEFHGSPADARRIVKGLRTRKALLALAASVAVPSSFFVTNGLIAPDPKPVPKPVPVTSTKAPTVKPTPKPTTTKVTPTRTGTSTGTATTSAPPSLTDGPTAVPTTVPTVAPTVTVTALRTVTTTATIRVTVRSTVRVTTPRPARHYVIVRPGDTLTAIAAAEDTTVARVRALNPRIVPTLLMPGTLVRTL